MEMALPPVIRIFFAIDLPAQAKKTIGSLIGTLKRKSRSKGIRWSKPDNLHITLQFLAEVESRHLPEVLDKVRQEVKACIQASSFSLGAVNLFPNPHHPRVIVLEVTPQDHLAQLSELIGRGIKASQYEIETRPFRAHLTLGRIKYPRETNLGFLSDCLLPPCEAIEIKEVILFRSEPQPDGSAYTVLEKIKLGA